MCKVPKSRSAIANSRPTPKKSPMAVQQQSLQPKLSRSDVHSASTKDSAPALNTAPVVVGESFNALITRSSEPTATMTKTRATTVAPSSDQSLTSTKKSKKTRSIRPAESRKAKSSEPSKTDCEHETKTEKKLSTKTGASKKALTSPTTALPLPPKSCELVSQSLPQNSLPKSSDSLLSQSKSEAEH